MVGKPNDLLGAHRAAPTNNCWPCAPLDTPQSAIPGRLQTGRITSAPFAQQIGHGSYAFVGQFHPAAPLVVDVLVTTDQLLALQDTQPPQRGSGGNLGGDARRSDRDPGPATFATNRSSSMSHAGSAKRSASRCPNRRIRFSYSARASWASPGRSSTLQCGVSKIMCAEKSDCYHRFRRGL